MTWKRPLTGSRTGCYRRAEREMPSSRIGEPVLEELKSLDEVAYVRFASVYRSSET